MNFKKKLLARHLIFFLSLPIYCSSQTNPSSPQGPYSSPLVIQVANLPTSHYPGLNAIVASHEGKLIVSGSNSIWVFDGMNWESRPLSGKPVFTHNNGKTVIAYNNHIETLDFLAQDEIRVNILLDSTEYKGVGDISTIISNSEKLYFTTPFGLWVFYDKLEKVDSSESWLQLLGNEHTVFYAKANHGIFRINSENNTTNLIPNTSHFVNSNLVQVFEFANTTLAITRNSPWIIPLEAAKKKTFSQLANYLGLINAKIRNAYVSHKRLFILTESNGVVVLGEEGNIISHVKIETPIGKTHVTGMFPLSKDVLLLLTPSSIVSAISTEISGVYSTSCGVVAQPNSILYSNGYLYCSTRDNTIGSKYILGHPNSLQFSKILGVEGSISHLHVFNSEVFGVGKDGVYKLKGLYASKVNKRISKSNSDLFTFAELNSKLWLIASYDTSLTAFNISDRDEEWFSIPFPVHNQQIEELYFYDGQIFSLTSSGKWFMSKLASSFGGWQEIILPKSLQGTFYISSLRFQKPFVTTPANLLSFDYKSNSIGEHILYDSTGYTNPLYEDDNFLLAKRFVKSFPHVYTLWLYGYSHEGKSLTQKKPITALPTSEIISQAIVLPDTSIFIATTSGLFYFHRSEEIWDKPRVSIFRVKLESDSDSFTLKDGYLTNDGYDVSGLKVSSNLSLSATFASIGSNLWSLGLNSTQYSSFIEGFDKDWTSWTSNHTRYISRIKTGYYTIKVKAKNHLGEESSVSSFSFSIKPQFFEIPIFIIAMAIIGLLGLIVLYQWRRHSHAKVRYKLESLINQRTEELVKEKEKTDNLLARVLPKDTASELKEKGRVNTQRFQVVTVLFCDIEGFTRITDETYPELLIDQLDKFFLYFDSVVEKYKIEKIKTIGDAYMCAGGIPKKNRTNPVEVVLAALEMMYYMRDITAKSGSPHNVWELRIGIDTGPVIAGVVGRNKLSYDIWGSTVNTASRMESSGEAGQINISGNTFTLVKEYFLCTFRGYMPVKNKGDIQMYFVKGIRPNLSEGTLGVVPNEEFKILLQIIRLGDLEDFLLDKLEKGLPKNLYYHNLKHTVDVYTQVELIGRAENVSKEDLLLLRTAALFHDAGHLIDYDTHEEMAVKLVREILPEYQYTDRQIEIISQLIMCTKLPPDPKNILEEIMCDADLDYLGRPDFIPVSNMLYKELHEHGKVGTLREWNEMQIKFIDKHSYLTKTARRLRNVNKQSQLDKLKNWLEKN